MIIDSHKFYLEYMNEYKTVMKMACDYDITEGMAELLLQCGREINEQEAKEAKRLERKKMNKLIGKQANTKGKQS